MICTNKLTGLKADVTFLTQFPAKYRGLRITSEHPYLVIYPNGVFFALSEEKFNEQFEEGEKPEVVPIELPEVPEEPEEIFI